MDSKKKKDTKKEGEVEKEEIEQEVQLESEEQTDAIVLEARIQDLEKQLEEERNAKLRALADCQNIRNMANREREELLRFAQNALLVKILDLADDFKHLFEHKTEGLDEVWIGIEAIYQKLQSIIADEGVDVVEVHEMDQFNPGIHEAIGFVTVTNDEDNQKVAKVVSNGYKRKDNERVIKSAKVIVNKKD